MNFWQLLILGAIGGLVTYIFQQRAWKREHIERIRQGERDKAVEISSNILELIGERLFAQRGFCIETRTGKVSPENHSAYSDIVRRWNSRLPQIEASLRHFFSDDLRMSFLRQVHQPLQRNGAVAERVLRWGYQDLSPEHKQDTDSLVSDLNLVSFSVKIWITEMDSRIENEEYGLSRSIDSLDFSDPDLVSINYLFRRLFNFPRRRA